MAIRSKASSSGKRFKTGCQECVTTVYFHIHIFSHTVVMRMSKDTKYNLKEIADSTVEFCKTLNGRERTDIIAESLEDYYFTVDLQSPISIQRHYRELFSRLVKNFGH